jgi:hypothetical protein
MATASFAIHAGVMIKREAPVNFETALIERVVSGEHEAFAELLKPYERMIFLSALSILGNEAERGGGSPGSDPESVPGAATVSPRGKIQHLAGADNDQRVENEVAERPAEPLRLPRRAAVNARFPEHDYTGGSIRDDYAKQPVRPQPDGQVPASGVLTAVV